MQTERVEWLWYGRLPRGKFVVLDGDPGQGKSGITIDLTARVSTGAPMPDETQKQRREPRNVIIISYEDGAADTIRPRLPHSPVLSPVPPRTQSEKNQAGNSGTT